MKKNTKKILLIIAGLLIIIIIYFGVKVRHYQNTNPEALCNRGGGSWVPVNNDDCSDLCSVSQADRACEDRLRMMSCSCGLDGCWDGEKCTSK